MYTFSFNINKVILIRPDNSESALAKHLRIVLNI